MLPSHVIGGALPRIATLQPSHKPLRNVARSARMAGRRVAPALVAYSLSSCRGASAPTHAHTHALQSIDSTRERGEPITLEVRLRSPPVHIAIVR